MRGRCNFRKHTQRRHCKSLAAVPVKYDVQRWQLRVSTAGGTLQLALGPVSFRVAAANEFAAALRTGLRAHAHARHAMGAVLAFHPRAQLCKTFLPFSRLGSGGRLLPQIRADSQKRARGSQKYIPDKTNDSIPRYQKKSYKKYESKELYRFSFLVREFRL